MTRLITAGLASALLIGMSGAQPPLARQFARGIVLVELRVGDAPGWALVDTGSPYTYVDSALRDDLCGRPDASAKTAPAKTAEAKLWIGGRLTVKQTVRFLDLQPFNDSAAKRPLIAILGRDLLGGYAIGVDFKRGMMRLWKGGRVPLETVRRWGDGKEKGGMGIDVHVDRPGASGGEVLALDLGVEKESGAWVLQCRPGRGAGLPLHLDTGSTCTSIHWKQLEGLGLKVARTETVADVFGASVRRVMVLPEMTVGSLALRDVEVYVDEEGVQADVLAPKDLAVQWFVVDPIAGKLYVPSGSSGA